MTKIFTFSALLMLFFSFKYPSTDQIPQKEYDRLPGVIKLGDNLYFDKMEMTNFSWLEYLYWNKRIFGENSEEYKSALPDSTVWQKQGEVFNVYGLDYLRHPAYYNLPVVGITYEQAVDFTRWRSDRVFEYKLIIWEIIEQNTDQNSTNYFTIDGFFSDEKYKAYHNIKYPCYQLPSSTDWEKLYNKAEAYNDSKLKHCKPETFWNKLGMGEPYCTGLLNENGLVINSSDEQDSLSLPLVDPFCWRCKKDVFYHLYGNIAEITADGKYVIGGSWKDSKTKILKKEKQDYNGANSYTGFRNICTWKTYK